MANPLFKAAESMAVKSLAKAALVNGSIEFEFPSGYGNSPTWTDWSHDRAVREGYKASHWVYAAIRCIQRAAASVPWMAVEGGEDRPDHELTRLFAMPNAETAGSTFLQEIIAYLYLGGNALVPKVRGPRSPQRGIPGVRELWALSPEGWRAIPAKRGLVDRYEKGTGADRVVYKPSELIHLKFPDPGNPRWGMAPLMAAAMSVDTDVEAVKWNKIALQNRAVADGAMVTPNNLTDEQYLRMKTQMRQQHQGAKNAREPFLLEGGVDWKQMSLSPAEMDFVNSRRTTREDILAVFGVPPACLGIVQSATQSDVEAMNLQLWVSTVIPLLSDIRDAFNLSLAPEFGPDVKLRFDLSDIPALALQLRQKIEAAKELSEMGVPVSEINRLLSIGLKEYEGWGSSALSRPAPLPLAAGYEPRSKSLWPNALSKAAPPEKDIAKAADDVLGNEAEESARLVERNGASYALSALPLVQEDWQKRWKDTLSPLLLKTMEASGTVAGVVFDVRNPEMGSYFAGYVDNLGRDLSHTSRDNVIRILQGAVDEGLSVPDTAVRLRGKLAELSEARSTLIARTELVRASNGASLIQAKSSGAAKTKTWTTAQDERVRPVHANMEGETVGVDEAFSNGLQSPGEPRCRCTLIYGLSDEFSAA